MAYLANYELSIISHATLANIESLGLVPPRSTFLPYAEAVSTASGGMRGLGWASAVWEWDLMSEAQYNALKAFCTGASVPCWIRTLKADMLNYGYYTGYMRWPQPPDQRRAGRALQIRVEFVALVEYTP